MNSLYQRLQDTAKRLINSYGKPAQIERKTNSGTPHNPAIHTAAYGVTLVDIGYSLTNRNETLIQAGDKRGIIATQGRSAGSLLGGPYVAGDGWTVAGDVATCDGSQLADSLIYKVVDLPATGHYAISAKVTRNAGNAWLYFNGKIVEGGYSVSYYSGGPVIVGLMVDADFVGTMEQLTLEHFVVAPEMSDVLVIDGRRYNFTDLQPLKPGGLTLLYEYTARE